MWFFFSTNILPKNLGWGGDIFFFLTRDAKYLNTSLTVHQQNMIIVTRDVIQHYFFRPVVIESGRDIILLVLVCSGVRQ